MVLLDTNLLPKDAVIRLTAIAKGYGTVVDYYSTNGDEVIERCKNCDIIITNKTVITENHLSQLPNVKYIMEIATGYDNVDVAAAKKYNIKVSNIPNYSNTSVAQHAVALLLELFNHVTYWHDKVNNNQWCDKDSLINTELQGLTFGCLGFGSIAKTVIPIVRALGMKIIVSSRTNTIDSELPVKFVDRETLFRQSDVLSLHCPANDDTYHIVNSQSLALMKKSSYIINTSRGNLIDEDALYNALVDGSISGAALDVLAKEPADNNHKLLSLKNCIITPHVAYLTNLSIERWLNTFTLCLEGFSKNKPINVVT
ncbi:MAG: NAD(P)-dependent oxidoreductase [Neisseriaceae bacterium]